MFKLYVEKYSDDILAFIVVVACSLSLVVSELVFWFFVPLVLGVYFWRKYNFWIILGSSFYLFIVSYLMGAGTNGVIGIAVHLLVLGAMVGVVSFGEKVIQALKKGNLEKNRRVRFMVFVSLSMIILFNLYASLPFLGLIESKVVWENNPLGFWRVQNSGSGEYQLTISAEIVKGRTGSLYVRRIPGQYSTIYIYRDFGPPVNWSGYDYLEIWFYGNNTGDSMRLWLRSENNWENRSFYEWSDHWVGWKRITFRLQNPTYTGAAGDVNLSIIDMIGIDGLTQHYIGAGTLLRTNSYLPYIRGENLDDRVFVYAAINVFGSAMFLFVLWFPFIKMGNNVKRNKQNSVEFRGRFLPAFNMLNLKREDFMLDVGCSSGDLLQKLYRRGFENLVGIDIDKERVHRSPRHLSVAVGSGLSMPFNDRVFTKATMLEVLEHAPIQNRLEVLREICRVLKPEGELIISVPTKSLFGYFDAGVWMGLHDSISLTKLSQLLQVAGFDLCEIYQAGGFWQILEIYFYGRRLSLFRLIKIIKEPSDIEKTPGWMLKKIDEEYQTRSNLGITLFIKAKKKKMSYQN